MLVKDVLTMREVMDDYFKKVFFLSGASAKDTSAMLDISKRCVGYWLRRLGLSERRSGIKMVNLTPQQRDHFENMNNW
jgi:hypothetical protein